jgi:hypothetical protein
MLRSPEPEACTANVGNALTYLVTVLPTLAVVVISTGGVALVVMAVMPTGTGA